MKIRGGTVNIQRKWMVAIFLLLASPINAIIYQNYQYQHHQRSRMPSYLLQTQKYVAVPGRVVQQYREYPLYTVPLSRLAAPVIQRVPLFPPRFRIEADSESSSSPPEDSEEEMNQQEAQPQPGVEPEEPPPAGEPEPQPEEPPPSEPEQPPMSPPPPAEDSQSHHHPQVIHKHISIHIPPEEMEDEEVAIIRPRLPQPDKRVNIIFIKAPSPKPKKTEVILPDKPQEKTLIYVLVKKSSPEESVRVVGPAPTDPPKPQVFYIKYKQSKDANSPPSYRVFTAKNQGSYH